jgi:hypothetical protein
MHATLFYDINKKIIINYDKEDIIDKIYFLEYKIPTKEHINTYINEKKDIDDTINAIINKFFIKNVNNGIMKIKKYVSKIKYKMPMYDPYSENIYLINKNNVFKKLHYDHYRFPDKHLINDIKKIYELKKKNVNIETADVLLLKKIYKFELMIDFMNNFNIKTLYKTYLYILYNDTLEIGGNLTICKKPSFMRYFSHMNPYYSKKELINLSLNMGIKKNKILLSNDINTLCKNVIKNDISSDILKCHYEHIDLNDMISLMQYYTLQGSYFLNTYLRENKYDNELYNNIILTLQKLIKTSPQFDNSYTLYRFITSDDHLIKLKEGDIYTELGFTSTTRDPFYKPDYQFGTILLKIKIPKNIQGVALCIETISNFPSEQEIILPPFTSYKLKKINEKVKYYHINENMANVIKSKYEFEYIGNLSTFDVKISNDNLLLNNNDIDFLKLEQQTLYTLKDKLNVFINNYTNSINQFNVNIGNVSYPIIVEKYNSTNVYKKFFAINVNDGCFFYTIINNKIIFTIEFFEDMEIGLSMHVNYLGRYNVINDLQIKEYDFILFLSSIGYYFNISEIYIYASYRDSNKTIKPHDKYKLFKHNYCEDFYNYIKYKKKRFDKFTSEISPIFSYYQLDKLCNTSVMNIIKKKDNDEIYQIYDKIFKIEFDDNIADFYLYIINNYPILSNILVNKFNRIYSDNHNPFLHDKYLLNAYNFLYNNNNISYIPEKTINFININNNKNKFIKNTYRL